MAVATMHNFFSLGWAVTLACIQGLIQKEGVFLRTPKSQAQSKLWHALRVTQWETAIGLVCVAAGLLAFSLNPNFRTAALCSLLFWQSSLYLAAPFYSVVSSFAKRAHAASVTDQGLPIPEHLAARWAVGFVIGMIFSLSLIRTLPTPAELPWYARYLPVDLHADISPIEAATGIERSVTEESIPAISKAGGNGTSATEEPTPRSISPDGPVARVSIHSTHCWTGPGNRYKKLGLLLNGQELQIIGKNADPLNPWWYVINPDTGEECWLWFYAAETRGPVEDVPVIEIE